MTHSQATRYLTLLGVPDQAPSVAALRRLVTAHLSRIPFENVSKLIQHAHNEPPTVIDLDRFLDLVDHASLGGTCYACGSHLNALLRHLGYDARLCGAAMSRPERYVLHPRGERHRSRLDHLRGDTIVHGYTVDPTPRDPDHFAPMIADSFQPESEFLNRLRIVRHRPDCSISLSDFTITITEGDVVRARTLPDRETLRDVIEVLFQIPGRVTAEAMAALDGRTEVWR